MARVNSLGCTSSIGFVGAPQEGRTSGYAIRAVNVRNNEPGLSIDSVNGPNHAPLAGDSLCVAAPVRGSTPLNSAGTAATANDCSGAYPIAFSSFAAGLPGGSPLTTRRCRTP